MRMILVVSYTLAALALGFLPGGHGEKLNRPIAIDKVVDQELHAVNLSGVVYTLRPTATGMALAGEFSLPQNYYPADLSSAQLGEKPWIFVSGNTEQGGRITQYAPDGSIAKFWPLFGRRVSGLDIDCNLQKAFVASSDYAAIFEIDLARNDIPRQLTSIAGGRKLGPLTVDAVHHVIYVADTETGTIYKLNTEKPAPRVVARGLGDPEALLISDGILYVADTVKKKIYSIRPDEESGTLKVFSSLHEFRSLSGLGRMNGGRIAVADDFAGVLFVLSRDGTLLYKYPES